MMDAPTADDARLLAEPTAVPTESRRDMNAEARVQAAIVEWVRVVAQDVLIFHVPNGRLRSKAEAARLRWTGVVAGVPDLAIVSPGGTVRFIEVKTATGRLSADQRHVQDVLTALGTPPAICRSIDDARLAFAAWGIRTREHHAPAASRLSRTTAEAERV